MDKSKPKVTPWPDDHPITHQAVEARMKMEGLPFYQWSNAADDVYPTHDHPYHKVIYVLNGSIAFGLPDSGEHINLLAGDRLDLPAGIAHNAVVGHGGVVCLEGHRQTV